MKEQKEANTGLLIPSGELAPNKKRALAGLIAQQKKYIATNGNPNSELAKKISEFKKEQQIKKTITSTKVNITHDLQERGAEQWFVLPKPSELENHNDVLVVLGSPIIDALREKYEKTYNTSIDDTQNTRFKNGNPQQRLAYNREHEKQRAFMEKYKDPEALKDFDPTFSHQAASKFFTDKYEHIEPNLHNDSQNKDTREYNFSGGTLKIKYNEDTKNYNIETEGSIPGTFSICIKRRTPSGKIIGDSYDILAHRDDKFYFYTNSGKGMLSIQSVNSLLTETKQTKNLDLTLPEAATALKQATSTEKTPSKITTSEPAQETQAEAISTPATPEPKQEEPAPTPANPGPKQNTQEETTNLKDASYFREQLQKANEVETSDTTKKYLISQISKIENKPTEEIRKEFGMEAEEIKKAKPKQNQRIATPVIKSEEKKAPKQKIDPQENTSTKKTTPKKDPKTKPQTEKKGPPTELEQIKEQLRKALSQTSVTPANDSTPTKKHGKSR